MTPTHIQIAEWREKFESGFQYKPTIDDDGDYLDNTQVMWTGYIRAHTEQTAQIAELKAKLVGAEAEIAALKQGLHRADEKLAEVIPLAKFGAMTMKTESCLAFHRTGLLVNATNCGVLVATEDVFSAVVYAPNIEATIETILKGEK